MTATATPKSGGCPQLDSQLLQLTQAADPPAFATAHGLDYQNGMVRVIVDLRAGASLPLGYGLVVEAQYANLVQAWVPPSQLCALASDANVLSVRPPARAALQV